MPIPALTRLPYAVSIAAGTNPADALTPTLASGRSMLGYRVYPHAPASSIARTVAASRPLLTASTFTAEDALKRTFVQGYFDILTSDIERLSGRAPKSFRDVVRAALAMLSAIHERPNRRKP